MKRSRAIAQLVQIINSIHQKHPVRVAIDGVDASGKTKLADELVEPLESAGRNVIRVSIDRFHNPREIRYRQGKNSPKGYYEDSFNYESLIANVLEPLGPEGDLKFMPTSYNFISNSEAPCSPNQADKKSILLFDGVFLHHPKIARYWDFTVFVHASFKTTLKRAMDRDLYLFKTTDQIEKMYLSKYIPGQKIYLQTEAPKDKANVIFYNDSIENPDLEIH